jgi:hypothetical protein
MTPRPQNGFGVFFLIYFSGSGKGRFCRGFCEIWRAERGFCVVIRGGVVVETWLETTANWLSKICQLFGIYFCA